MEKSTVSTNRKAYHEFQIIETFEAGIELLGSEVKSLREGNASLRESYVLIKKGQAWLVGMHISAYSHTGFSGHEPVRERRLLLHKNEILKIKFFFCSIKLKLILLIRSFSLSKKSFFLKSLNHFSFLSK